MVKIILKITGHILYFLDEYKFGRYDMIVITLQPSRKKNIRTFFFQFYNNKNRTSLLIWIQNIFQKWLRLMFHYNKLITMKDNYNMSYLMRLYTFYSCTYCYHNCLSCISLFTTPCHLISEVTVLAVSITSSCKSVTT